MHATTKTAAVIPPPDSASSHRQSSSSPPTAAASASASSTASTAPPVFLQLDERSFSHLSLQQHNFLHVYVGRVGSKLMILPLVLHLHQSVLRLPATAVLAPLFTRLPSLIADVNIGRVKNVRDKPKLLHTPDLLFAYQFKETHPMYTVMVSSTARMTAAETVVNPQSLSHRVSHPLIDSEADQSDADDGSTLLGDGLHTSDEDAADDEDEDEVDAVAASEDEAAEPEAGDAQLYRGRRYRAFHVSKHSLYVRAVGRQHDAGGGGGGGGGRAEEQKQKAGPGEAERAKRPSPAVKRKASSAGHAVPSSSASASASASASVIAAAAASKVEAVIVDDDDDFF